MKTTARRTILVTRPEPAATALAEAVRAKGHAPLLAPMMSYEDTRALLPAASSYDTLAFTSAEAVRGFARRATGRNMPVFCVGTATAAEAKTAGFKDINCANGSGQSLARLLAGRPGVLHVRGADVAEDLGQEHSVVLYRAVLAERLPEHAARALRAGEVDTALLFSARAAQNLARLLSAPDFENSIPSLRVLCISSRVAEIIRHMPWQALRIAPECTQNAMLAAMDEEKPG